MDPEKIMDGLSKELGTALKAISNAKTVEEKLAYSQIKKIYVNHWAFSWI